MTTIFRKTILFMAFGYVAIAGPGNYNQQGPKLVGTGSVPSANGIVFQGFSVSLSGDGNTALVGGYGDNSFAGAAWVFTRNNGVWSQQGQKLVGTGASGSPGQGKAVALSGDGSTAVSSGISDTDPSAFGGAVWVFTRSGGVWTQQGPKLVGTGAICCAGEQGYAVAISADGNTLVEGAPLDNGSVYPCEPDNPEGDQCAKGDGAVWVFTRSNGIWKQQSKLVGTNSSGFMQGNYVSLSSDGNTLAEGGFNYELERATVWVFTRVNGTWTQQAELIGVNAPVQLTADGDTLLSNDRFFHRDQGVWSDTGETVSPPGGLTALSGDGTAAVGFVRVNGIFEIGLFTKSNNVWSLHHTYLGSGAVGPLGVTLYSLALSANGNTMIEGSYTDNNNLGAAWIFAAPQLSTSLTHTGSFHLGQTGAAYTITVTNSGDRAAHSPVNLVDRLPSGLTGTAISGAGWTCTLTTLSCTRSDELAVGASYPPVTVVVNVAATVPASVTNVATASGGGSNWGNAKDVTTIVP